MKRFLLLLLLAAMPLHAEIFEIGQLKLENYRGKVVYLDFWASWCGPCRESFPWMNSLLERYPADDFAVVAINLDQEPGAMQRFLRQTPAGFDIYYDPSGRIAESFGVEAMPTSYLIDADGKVVRRHHGFYRKHTDRYQREIEELL